MSILNRLKQWNNTNSLLSSQYLQHLKYLISWPYPTLSPIPVLIPLSNNNIPQQQQSLGPAWDMFSNGSTLLAVPKKKVSHMKKRQKLYGPGDKQLKLNNNLNECPSCGHYKRSHTLCMYCFGEIKMIWKNNIKKIELEKSKLNNDDPINEIDQRLLYPGKVKTDYEIKLEDKDKYLLKRLRTLPVNEK
ncbi:hypothetical protein TBLA_0C00710 [Henningerozyma blattae CBS 6284]|uniref:Large ribosomal subunit protein bL32m n=1 Tax=Henningerozyma blattae (strain ATCC 34711 / CBS 6284 / DSM 70876 / NBRC 10599 / NRRL Y-10934 / UCD 77-7) TaxID=1071380 RepID=I2H0I5_HENB6|nr:hypothetical protein TBLA_0C00710 [Tetrapisispora blattae CBS 6284]CCH59887.1 hypothetical protein TBLA_0C00710 [Tetrapisispora blattae CBS 6284]